MLVHKFARTLTRPQVRAYASQAALTRVLEAVYNENGHPQCVVRLNERLLEPPTGNQVQVRMLFAPVNPTDLNVISGTYPAQSCPPLPAVGGAEGVGRVVSVGDRVSLLKVGDLVIPASDSLGTWRTHLNTDEKNLLAIQAPEGVTPEYLACLAVNPASAYRMLEDFVDLKEGDVIIQNGANSMVGLSVVQLAAAKGVKTINIIRRRSDYDELVERMKAYGAYIVVGDDYIRSGEFRQLISDLPKPKLALNCVGGESATELARFLGEGGVMVTYGGMSFKPVTMPTSSFIFNDIAFKGFWMSRWYATHFATEKKALFEKLAQLAATKKLRLWTERHSIEGISLALARAENSSCRDRKVLLKLDE